MILLAQLAVIGVVVVLVGGVVLAARAVWRLLPADEPFDEAMVRRAQQAEIDTLTSGRRDP